MPFMSTGGTPGKVSGFKLKASYWYVSHKLLLRRIGIALLVAASLGLYGYALYRSAVILFIDDRLRAEQLSQLSTELINYSYFHQAQGARDLEILSFDAVDTRGGRFDFVAQIANPNPDFVAHQVELELISGGQVVAEDSTFIYPEEEKYVAFFGEEFSAGANPVLRIAQTSWHRVHDFENFARPRLNFEVTNVSFQDARQAGLRGSLSVSTLRFDITNRSGFSYWQVGTYMILFSGQRIVGANFTTIDQFRSGETRNVEIRWYEPLAPVSRSLVLPEVDILDAASYMPVE